jgi:peptidyl-tRNA hydrolase, PTH1 family
MKLIIGLGNIGPTYDGTRHNIGFMLLDIFARTNDLSWQTKNKFKAMIAEGYVGTEKVILLKPTTYYNLSGEAALAAKQFYTINNTDILVVHDELALPFGTVRTRIGGSDAGNNGLKSIIACLGPDIARIRVGIATDMSAKQDAADFVIGHFSHQERTQLADIQKHALERIGAFIAGDFNHTTVVS